MAREPAALARDGIETRAYFEDRRMRKIPARFGPAFIPKTREGGGIKRVPLS